MRLQGRCPEDGFHVFFHSVIPCKEDSGSSTGLLRRPAFTERPDKLFVVPGKIRKRADDEHEADDGRDGPHGRASIVAEAIGFCDDRWYTDQDRHLGKTPQTFHVMEGLVTVF